MASIGILPDIIDWVLRPPIFAGNIWLLYCITTASEMKNTHFSVLLNTVVMNDIISFFMVVAHDLPSKFTAQSIFEELPFLYNLHIFLLRLTWFYMLIFLPFFSMLSLLAIMKPTAFWKISRKTVVVAIVTSYVVAVIPIVPLFTPWAGFKFFSEGKVWGFDYSKPYTSVYVLCNRILQTGCMGIVVISDVLIIYKLLKLRGSTQAFVQTRIEETATSSVDIHNNNNEVVRRRGLSREVRLAIMFIALSGCFITATLSYNILIRDSLFTAIVMVVAKNIGSAKWIIYALGNNSVRRVFMFPFKSILCL